MPELIRARRIVGAQHPSQATNHGYLVALEGPDGVGKSTLARELCRSLHQHGIDSCSLAFPGLETGSLGEHVYKLHHQPERFGIHRLNPASLQLLHVAAHIDTIEHRIRPALATGKWVILDRFWWSTWVYGLNAGIPRPILRAILRLELMVWEQLEPNVVFLVERSESTVKPADADEFRRLVSSYRELARTQMSVHPVHVVSNDDSVQVIAQRMTLLIQTGLRETQG